MDVQGIYLYENYVKVGYYNSSRIRNSGHATLIIGYTINGTEEIIVMTQKVIGVFLGLFFAVCMNVCAMDSEDEPTLIKDAMSKMSNTKTERLSEIEELMNDNLFQNGTNVLSMDGYREKSQNMI